MNVEKLLGIVLADADAREHNAVASELDAANKRIAELEAEAKSRTRREMQRSADWHVADEQREANGEFTPLAMALQALSDHGCDCGTDEPGACLGCLCEAALKDLWERNIALENGPDAATWQQAESWLALADALPDRVWLGTGTGEACVIRFVQELERKLEEREADMHVRIREGYDKTVADAWRAKVTELERQLASRTGPYCAHCGGQHLGTECRMRAAEVERDEARERCRRAAQILIAEFGSDGPLNVDEAAERAVRVARERADGLAQAVTDATAEVVERVCEAVRWEKPSPRWDHDVSPLSDNVLIGKMHLACGFGQTLVDRIRDEIRKAARR